MANKGNRGKSGNRKNCRSAGKGDDLNNIRNMSQQGALGDMGSTRNSDPGSGQSTEPDEDNYSVRIDLLVRDVVVVMNDRFGLDVPSPTYGSFCIGLGRHVLERYTSAYKAGITESELEPLSLTFPVQRKWQELGQWGAVTDHKTFMEVLNINLGFPK